MVLKNIFGSLFGRAEVTNQRYPSVEAVRKVVIKRLLAARPSISTIEIDANDPARFLFDLDGNQSSGDVSNLYGYICSYPDEDDDELIDRFVRMLTPTANPSRENLVTLIRTKDYLDLLKDGEQVPISAPLIGDLVACGMYDMPDATVTATIDQFPNEANVQLLELGTANMKPWIEKIVFDRSIEPIVLCYVDGNPIVTSGLLLADEFWSIVDREISNDVFVALPRRDQVFLLDASQANAIPAMQKMIEVTFEDNFNLLSDQLFRRRNGKLEAVGH